MNYQAGAALMGHPSIGIPVGSDWRRVNFALAGFGYVVPGSVSTAKPAELSPSLAPTAVLTITLRGD